jgi:peptide/nickel transport system substrate-binding protein
MCIVSPKALETHGEDYTAHPSGTGPYIFEKWDRDAQYVVKANPDYWGPKPKCGRAILSVVKEAPVRVDQLLAGEADVITGIAPADVPRLEEDSDVEIVTAPAINFACLGFLMFKEPFNDVRLRQAVNYAIDRDTSVKFLYGDYGIPLQTCLPKASWAYNDKIEGYPYNPDKAKQLLAEAGHADGFSFEALTFTQQRPYCPLGMTKVAEIIQADLKKVGIQMNLRPMPGVGETEDAAARSEGDAYFTGYYFTGDPGPIFNSIWHTNSSAPDGGNLPRYSNPEVDKLIEQALPESDQEKRKQIYWDIQEMIIADAPAVFINSYAMMRGVRSNVKNFKIQPDNNDHLWLVDKV